MLPVSIFNADMAYREHTQGNITKPPNACVNGQGNAWQRLSKLTAWWGFPDSMKYSLARPTLLGGGMVKALIVLNFLLQALETVSVKLDPLHIRGY